MVYTHPQESPPGDAGSAEPVLSLAEDRVLRRIVTRDVISSDDLADELFPFVHPDDTFEALDRLDYLGLVEIRSVSRFIGFHGIRPRCVMITQKGHDYTKRMRAQDGRVFLALAGGLPAGLLVWLADAVLQIEYMGMVAFGMAATAAAGLAVRKMIRIVIGRN